MVLLLPVKEVGRSDGKPIKPLLRNLFGDLHETIRIFVGQRAQQDRVDDAKDGGVGADAEGERDDRHGREAGVLRQHAQAVSHVLKKGTHNFLPRGFSSVASIEK